MSNIYDNLNIVETAVTYDGRTVTGSFAISQNDFNLSTLNFLPNVPYEDQIEVERIFDTGIDSKFDEVVFTIADRRNMFVLAKDWYTINPQTKRMTINIPSDTVDDNGLYYPESRTYMTEGVINIAASQRVDIPTTLQHTTTTYLVGDKLVTREPDVIIIRRKTLSKDSIVTFAPGTRLTTTQLNLQFNQLKYILQELIAKVRNEVILKYDENAIDGPFLGNTDLKMSGRYIKQVNSPSIKDVNTETGYPFEVGNTVVQGKEFVVNHSKLLEALFFTTMHRTGLTEGDAAFSGHFTAAAQDSSGGASTNRKIINLANGTDDTDAATFGQVKNATNISTGTLTNTVLSNIPLSKLSTASGQTFTLPVEYLANSGVTAGSSVSAGSTSASNTSNMVSMTVDNKGRVTTIASRNMAVEDLPTVAGLTAGIYGQSTANNSNNMVSFTVDAKGRLTAASQRSLLNADLPTSAGVTSGTYGATSGTGTNTLTRFTVNDKGIITSAAHRSIEVNDLPATSVAGAGTYGQTTANNSNNMLQVIYDTKGRVTSITHRSMGINDLPNSIPLGKLSPDSSQGYTLPSDAIANNSISISKVSFATGGIINSAVLPSIDLDNINPANRGDFILPDAALNNIVTAAVYNTQPVKDITVDAKGRVTAVTQRAIAGGDIPDLSADKITSGVFNDDRIPAPSTAPTFGTYGTVNQVPVITVDAKGRINTISTSTALQTTNLSDFASASNTLIDARALSRGTGSTYDAGSRRIINVSNPTNDQDAVTRKFITDSYTTTANLGAAVLTTIQSNSVYWDSTNSIFTASRSSIDQKITGVAQPTANNHAVNKQYADTTFQTISGLSGSVVPLVTANALAWDSVNSVYTANNGSNRRIANVSNPLNPQDVVTRNYLEANALVASGGVITAGGSRLTGLGTPTPGTAIGSDAVNFALLESVVLTNAQASGQLVGSTLPQVYRSPAPTPTTNDPTTGWNKYAFAFVDGTNPLYATTSTMVIVEIEGSSIKCVPQTGAPPSGTVFNGWFYLDISGSTKTVYLYTNTSITGTNVIIRNFGLSRLVSGALATTASTGLVAILTGDEGGIAVDGNGYISLKKATTSQIGGIKQGTGLSIAGTGIASVDLTDSLNVTNPNKVASAKAVNDLRLASMLLDGTQQMTGRLRTVAGTASLASLNIPVATAALTSFTAGDLWNSNNTLQFRTASATKQIAFTDDATTSTKGLVQITSGNDGGIAISSGSISLQQASSTQLGGIKQGTGLTISSGVAAVNLTDSVSTTSSSTAASATAVKAAYDYAGGVQSNLNATNNSLNTTNNNVTNATNIANAALPKAGGTMTGMILLPASTTTLVPLRFVAGSEPNSPTSGDIWYESNTLKFRNSAGTKTIAFTDSSLTGSAASANKLTTAQSIALQGDVTGSVNFDGSVGVTITTTIAADSVALGTDTTGDYVATATGGTGISVTGAGTEARGITITNTDLGSSQNIYKTVTLAGTTTGDTNIVAASNSSILTLTGGTGISLAGNNSTKTITITNTSTPPNNFGTVVVGTTPTPTNLVADSSSDTLTINQGTGITLTAAAGTDEFTITNAGVTSLTGTSDHVNVSASTGAVTLSLPQAIHTAATPTFGSVTAKNLTLGSSNNTIISTDTNGNINLAPNGTGFVNITKALDVEGTLNVDGATTLAGNVTINSPSTLTLLNAAGKISLGAASSTTSINRQTSATAPAAIGDLVFRVPASGKAWLVGAASDATAPIAANEIVTQGSLATALGSYATTASLGTYLTFAGGLNAGAQALGTSNANPFTIATNNVTRVTVGAGGGMTINSGGITVTDGNITIQGSAGKVTAAASTVAGDGDKTLATKDYVDALVATLQPKFKNVAGVGQIVPIGEPGTGTTGNTGTNTLNKPQSLTLTIPGTSGQVWFWFVQNTNGTNGGGHTFCTLGPGGTVLTGHAGSWYWSGFAIRIT